MGEAANAIRTIVEAIHSSPTQAVVYLSGDASLALGWLMSVPGASNTLLEAVVPYSRISMVQLLGRVPTQHCNQAMAEELASLAYNQDFLFSVWVLLDLWQLLQNVGITESTEPRGRRQAVKLCTDPEAYGSNVDRKIILPGSFNPLHDGHLKLLEVATSVCKGGYPCFEISAINADKPPLSVAQIKDRVKQFEAVGKTILVSNQPYFYKKAERFPGSSFVIGADTAARFVNPKYYEGSYKRMLEILGDCKKTGCTFLVGGCNVDGVFKVLEDLDLPEDIIDMFISIPADIFRRDISSTEIRKTQGGPISYYTS